MLGPGQSTVSLADYGCFVPALVAAMVHPKLPASIWIHTSDLLLLLSASTRGASARPARARQGLPRPHRPRQRAGMGGCFRIYVPRWLRLLVLGSGGGDGTP